MSIFRGYVNKFGMYYWRFAKPKLPVGGRRLFFFSKFVVNGKRWNEEGDGEN
jgi:hypothetical protein